ncbi:endonuclease/exonuclease/phosphatase family protein [Puteibacter caeruleilacunae]|nr:endonuclease/exonuclease/phosphatase family protein [Puteibacter caeruleilacunae]
MKIVLALIVSMTVLSGMAQKTINLMSYNIRYNNPGDGVNAWDNRKDLVTSLVKFHQTDILCAQEVLDGQLNDILDRFPGWKFVGVGRDDGKKAGEYAPIFFNPAKFKLLDNGHFWLGEDPTKPQKGWDAVCIRITTWAKLKSKKTKQEFYVFNTHFDHVGKVAQRNSATLIMDKMKELAHGKLPIILTGDFNLNPTSEAILLLSKHLNDSKFSSELPPYGPEGTFNSFKFDHPLKSRIDYIFTNDKVKVHRYGVLSDSKDQRYYSDHLPVLTEISF